LIGRSKSAASLALLLILAPSAAGAEERLPVHLCGLTSPDQLAAAVRLDDILATATLVPADPSTCDGPAQVVRIRFVAKGTEQVAVLLDGPVMALERLVPWLVAADEGLRRLVEKGRLTSFAILLEALLAEYRLTAAALGLAPDGTPLPGPAALTEAPGSGDPGEAMSPVPGSTAPTGAGLGAGAVPPSSRPTAGAGPGTATREPAAGAREGGAAGLEPRAGSTGTGAAAAGVPPGSRAGGPGTGSIGAAGSAAGADSPGTGAAGTAPASGVVTVVTGEGVDAVAPSPGTAAGTGSSGTRAAGSSAEGAGAPGGSGSPGAGPATPAGPGGSGPSGPGSAAGDPASPPGAHRVAPAPPRSRDVSFAPEAHLGVRAREPHLVAAELGVGIRLDRVFATARIQPRTDWVLEGRPLSVSATGIELGWLHPLWSGDDVRVHGRVAALAEKLEVRQLDVDEGARHEALDLGVVMGLALDRRVFGRLWVTAGAEAIWEPTAGEIVFEDDLLLVSEWKRVSFNGVGGRATLAISWGR
jgi:hypothetical protein